MSWASLALIKLRLGEFDEEMLFYLKQADILGPIKPEVHVAFAEIGLLLYTLNHPFFKQIGPTARSRVLQGIRHKDSRQRIYSIIKRTGSQKAICRWHNNAGYTFKPSFC